MRKLFSVILVLLLGVSDMSAKSLVITLSNGRKVYYLIDNDNVPVMRFSDNEMTVDNDTYRFSGIKEFRISEEDDPTGLEQIASSRPSMSLSESAIYIESADAVSVFTIDGKSVSVKVSDAGGLKTIDTSSLDKGVYVIKSGDTSFKFMKK
jgi:hypothetical protein